MSCVTILQMVDNVIQNYYWTVYERVGFLGLAVMVLQALNDPQGFTLPCLIYVILIIAMNLCQRFKGF